MDRKGAGGGSDVVGEGFRADSGVCPRERF